MMIVLWRKPLSIDFYFILKKTIIMLNYCLYISGIYNPKTFIDFSLLVEINIFTIIIIWYAWETLSESFWIVMTLF